MAGMFKRVLKHTGWCLLLSCWSASASAFFIAGSALSVSRLQISPAAGSLVYAGPFDVFASSNAFNSLGDSDSNGNAGTGIDVQADAAVAAAAGHAAAAASAATLTASSLVSLGGMANAAAVSSPGSLASLFGSFDIGGTSGMIDVTLSIDVSASLHGLADALGSFSTDGDASLEIDGMPVLFDFFSLAGGPNFADTTQAISETLNATVSLDSSQSHFFVLTSHVDGGGQNTSPEPGAFALAALGLGLLACGRLRRKAPGRLDPHPTAA